MAEEPMRGGIESRRTTLPDGTEVTIAVKAGTPQDDVDLMVAQIWQEIPDA